MNTFRSTSQLQSSDSNNPIRRPGREEIYLANILLDGRGEIQNALKIYEQFGPNSALVMIAGICLDSLGRDEEARICYRQALQLIGSDADYEAMMHLYINLQRQRLCKPQSDEHDDGDGLSIQNLMEKVESSPISAHIASSWKYISNQTKVGHLPYVYFYTHDMMQLAMENAILENGLILEFGVYYGKTIRMMANYFPDDIIHGFDTFEGLPGD